MYKKKTKPGPKDEIQEIKTTKLSEDIRKNLQNVEFDNVFLEMTAKHDQ